jgi:rubredoxin
MKNAIQKKPDSFQRKVQSNYFTMVGETRECPRCGQSYLFRSHRRPMEKMFLSLLGWKPYRCGTCEFRFYLEAKPDAVGQVPASSLVSRHESAR